eukprot:TRINITY_DN24655_c0_g2_i1.p1 TRINITY_DN24655_c0_g2~~TRINITY_DN24655_c0_g2_i1.p1  ORF type:complete len:249 (-),score=45.95 TRINITY_DN24655_c0_g2_i1:226-972(-)
MVDATVPPLDLTHGGECHFHIRIAVMGAPGVGKSAFVNYVTDTTGHFPRPGGEARPEARPEARLEASSARPFIALRHQVIERDDRTVIVEYWDTPGDPSLSKQTAKYCAGATGVILLFDVDRPETLAQIEPFLIAMERAGTLWKVLVGNQLRKGNTAGRIDDEAARRKFGRFNMPYFVVSTVDYEGVVECVSALLNTILDNIPEKSSEIDSGFLVKHGIWFGKLFSATPPPRPWFVPEHETTTFCDWL